MSKSQHRRIVSKTKTVPKKNPPRAPKPVSKSKKDVRRTTRPIAAHSTTRPPTVKKIVTKPKPPKPTGTILKTRRKPSTQVPRPALQAKVMVRKRKVVKRVPATKLPKHTGPMVPRKPAPGDALGFISQGLDKSWNNYLACLDRFQQSPSGKTVHDLRVSIRRFTSVVDLVDRFNPDNIVRRARLMLKEQLSELSTLRDIHVELVRVRQFLKQLPEMKTFYEELQSKEGRCLKAAKKMPWKANRKFIENAVNRAQIKLNARRSTTTTESARKIVETGLDVAFDGLSKRLQNVTLADYTSIHKVRLAFKPVRYTLEALQPVLSLDSKRLRNATILSKMMGQIQDLEVLMKDMIEFGWKKESVLSAVIEIWLDIERQKVETAQRFMKAIPKFSEIWKPIIFEQVDVTPSSKTLYVLRHGIAEQRSEINYPLDSDRPLTSKGLKRMRRVADGMRHLKVSFDAILSSPYKRALETAFVVGRQYGAGETIQTCGALRPEVLPEELIRVLQEQYTSSRTMLLVGHEPQLSALISTLTSGSAGARPLLKKGGLCKLEVDKIQACKCATMLWLLTPRQLVNIA